MGYNIYIFYNNVECGHYRIIAQFHEDFRYCVNLQQLQ